MAAQQEVHTGAGREEPVDPVFIEVAEIRQGVVQERDPKERVSGPLQALPDLRLSHEKVTLVAVRAARPGGVQLQDPDPGPADVTHIGAPGAVLAPAARRAEQTFGEGIELLQAPAQ